MQYVDMTKLFLLFIVIHKGKPEKQEIWVERKEQPKGRCLVFGIFLLPLI